VEANEQERLPLPAQVGSPYADEKVITAIRAKDGQSKFDVTKLLALVGELNDNYARNNTYASHALLRAILDTSRPSSVNRTSTRSSATTAGRRPTRST
jgi:hypothetical protein